MKKVIISILIIIILIVIFTYSYSAKQRFCATWGYCLGGLCVDFAPAKEYTPFDKYIFRYFPYPKCVLR